MPQKKNRHPLRITAGRWRGRECPYNHGSTLRPTLSRIRQTVFDWLQYRVQGASCLDLFAGSGIFALEALSRGADSALLIDQDAATCQQLRQHRELFVLDDHQWQVQQRGLPETPAEPFAEAFDLIFIDPPYDFDQWHALWCWLNDAGAWHEDTRMFIERPKGSMVWPSSAVIHRSTRSQHAGYYLVSLTQSIA